MSAVVESSSTTSTVIPSPPASASLNAYTFPATAPTTANNNKQVVELVTRAVSPTDFTKSAPLVDPETKRAVSVEGATLSFDPAEKRPHNTNPRLVRSASDQHPRMDAKDDGARPADGGAPMEYSALGREIVNGAPVQRVMSTFPFSEYLSNDASEPLGAPAPHPPPAHPMLLVQEQQQQQHAEAVARAATPHVYHNNPQPPPPPHRITHPQQIPMQYAPHLTPPQWRPPPPPPCCPPGEPCRHVHSTPPPQVSYSGGAHVQRMSPNVYYSPYSTPNMMIRSTSAQSSSNSSAYSDSEGYYSSQQSGSDYENGVCNPAYIHAAHNLSTSSFPGAIPHSYYAQQAGPSGEVSFVGLGGLRAASTSDLSRMDSLRIHDSGMGYAFPGSESPPELHRDLSRDATVRGRTTGSNKTIKPRTSSRTAAKTIFHPTPQAMLAPHALRRNTRLFPGTNSLGLPTDEEFSRMPTKRSRGRRPPCSPDLVFSSAADPNANPSPAQIRYCGVTKTGKPKKIFLCKVPGCSKCFKRSEHLKRHVRSIHTNEKPFQCQWKGCMKYFSRHDNLNQHLRIHRLPGQTDAEFSAQLESVFGQRMQQGEVDVESSDEDDY